MPLTRRRRPALLTALALLLAVEAVTTVAVRAAQISEVRSQVTAAPLPVAAQVAVPRAVIPGAVAVRPPVHDARLAGDSVAPTTVVTPVLSPVVSALARPARVVPAPVARAQVVKPKPEPKPRPVKHGGGGSSSPHRAHLVGRNHVWSPALGIDRRVYAFPCSRSQKPGNVVYRWGCAGRNNVYLMGHAANVFGGLDRAYSNGRLKPGLRVWYADANGKVRAYAVRWWKVVKPTPDAAWAWASLSTPSMTLQTCLGANSEYRLMVRLTRAG